MVTQFSMLAFTSTWRSLWRVMLIAYLAKSSLAADQDIILDSYNFHDSILNGSLIIKSFPYNMNAYIQYQTYNGIWNMTGSTIQAHWNHNLNDSYSLWTFNGEVGPYGISEFYLQLQLVEANKYLYNDNDGHYFKVDGGSPVSTAECKGYNVVHASVSNDVTTLDLALNGQGCALYSEDIKQLTVTITSYSSSTVRIKITDRANKRWQIPPDVVSEGTPDRHSIHTSSYKVSYSKSPFTFRVTRTTGEVIFDTSVSGMPSLIFEDEYLQISSVLPDNANVYGLGDMADTFRRSPDNTLQTMWSLDAGTARGNNGYGSHPVYFELRDGKVHGVFLRNSNGMDVALIKGQITYRILGGVLDFYVFDGPTPSAALDQYTSIIGKPAFIPLWTLGFHQCRWGGTWVSTQGIKDTVDSIQKAGLYLDTVWADINYMDNYHDFTLGSNFSDWNSYVETLHKQHLHHVPIVDPGIPNISGYKSYEEGLQEDVFLRWPNGSLFVGQVWPGDTVYEDWFHPKVGAWWTKQLQQFHTIDAFDGIWQDMNEASNFLTPAGYEPKYHINNNGANAKEGLNSRTISTNVSHYGGATEYNTHNLFGHYEAIHTHNALLSIHPGKRTFVLTRSSFAGTGVYSQKWNGDNAATWDDLYLSIPQIMSNQLFGIPMVGSDICGFNDATTEELCNRWAQLGAFYPFSRHHHSAGQPDSFFFLWKSVTESALKAYTIRYTLLPYLYSVMEENHRTGNAFMRPLWWHYPTDANTFALDKQFTIGEGLLVSPVLSENATTVDAYFPGGIWYEWYTGKKEADAAGVKTLNAPLTHVNVHIKGGIILPAQEPAKTTYATSRNPYSLIVALDKDGQSTGSLYVDDESLKPKYTRLTFKAKKNSISIKIAQNGYLVTPMLEKISVMGYQRTKVPTTLLVNGRRIQGANITMDHSTELLSLSGFKVGLNQNAEIEWL